MTDRPNNKAIITQGEMRPPPAVDAVRQNAAQAKFEAINQNLSARNQSGLTESERRFLIRMGIGVGTSLVIVVGFLLVRRSIRKANQNKAFQKVLEDGSPQSYANRFVMAFENDGWWGTQVEKVRSALLDIPSMEEFEEAAKQYKKLTRGNDLRADMKGELTSTEFEEMLMILRQKPKRKQDATGKPLYDPVAWAKRLYNAMSSVWFGFIGDTDEDAILKVIEEVPSKAAWNDVKEAYEAEYSASLEVDLDGDLGYWDFDWKAKIASKPPTGV